MHEAFGAVPPVPVKQRMGELMGDDEPGPVPVDLRAERLAADNAAHRQRWIDFDSITPMAERRQESLGTAGTAAQVGERQLDLKRLENAVQIKPCVSSLIPVAAKRIGDPGHETKCRNFH
jgi:hypothetical protein